MATNSFDDNAPSLSTSIPSENHSNAHLTDTDFDLTAPGCSGKTAPRKIWKAATGLSGQYQLWQQHRALAAGFFQTNTVDPILSNVPVPSKLFQQHEPIWTGAFLKCVCQYLRSQH